MLDVGCWLRRRFARLLNQHPTSNIQILDMPIKTYRPTTPTRRFATVVSREDITKDRPEKSLVESKKRTGGRNSTGRVTSRFIGGGAKQAYRVVDFKRDKIGIPAVVAAIEYDPNRSARLALLN